MLTGICPRCRVRRILALVETPDMAGRKIHRVRTHKCGRMLVPQDVEPLDKAMRKVSIHA